MKSTVFSRSSPGQPRSRLTRTSRWRPDLAYGNTVVGQPGDWPQDIHFKRPVRVAADPNWVEFEVVSSSGRASAIRLRIRSVVVEVWREENCCAVFSRGRLRAWLDAMPAEPLTVDEVVLAVDRAVDVRGRVAITLPDVEAWVLSPETLSKLRERV